MDYKSLQTRLFSLSDDAYRDFAKAGTPTDYPFLGVRLPDLRRLAREIVKNGQIAEFLAHDPRSFEELTLRAIVVASLPYPEMKAKILPLAKTIDNWGTCDTFANTAKSIRTHREDFLPTIDALLADPSSEFEARLALVLLLNHYLTPDYLPVVFDRVAAVKNREEYYIKMAIAWLLAECFIKFPTETEPFLATANLPKWTHNKTISKIRDSYRVDPDVKDALLALRK